MASSVPKYAAPSSARRVERRKALYADLLSAVHSRGGALALSLVCTLSLLASACGNELSGAGFGSGAGGGAGGGAAVRVAPSDPQGGYFVSVDASGSGCPAGSWQTDVSPDGQVFTTTFSAYEVSLTPERALSVSDCTVALKLHSPQGLSFSVTSLFYRGYGFLEPSMRGSFSARYGFRGNPDAASSYREERGPYDDLFQFEDSVTHARRSWSACGTDHDLTVRTQLSLYNGSPAGSGYVHLASIDGSTKVVLGLSWRSCRARARRQGV
jgi:hypothetical protein